MPSPTGTSRPEIPRRRLRLASRSPRRRQLLHDHGIDHESRHPGVEDSVLVPGPVRPEDWVAALAYLKAIAGLHTPSEPWDSPADRAIVIGADTVCVRDGQLLGTPTDAADAERILRTLSGGTHDVLTGVALVDSHTRQRTLFVDRASVRLGRLTDAQIAEYLASGQWQGKAGAYNLSERLAAGWPIEFVGDPSTIMGLPMRALARRLRDLGLISAPGPAAAEPGP